MISLHVGTVQFFSHCVVFLPSKQCCIVSSQISELMHALLLWTTDFDFFCFIFRVQSQTSQSHPHVQNPASAHHQVSWSIIHRIHCAFMKIVEVHVFLWFTILFLYMAAQEKYFFSTVFTYGLHPPDIQKVDNAHHQWINLYPLDSAVGFLNTYLSDSDVQTEDNAIHWFPLYLSSG